MHFGGHRLPSPRDCRRHWGFRRLRLDSIYNLDSPTVMASDRSPRGSEYLATFRKYERGMFPDLDYNAYDCRVTHECDNHVEGKGDTGRDVDEVGEGEEKVDEVLSEGVTPIERQLGLKTTIPMIRDVAVCFTTHVTGTFECHSR